MNRALILDVEGTTTSLAFVKETLFPYAATRLDAFLDAYEQRPDVAAILLEVQRLAAAPRATEPLNAAQGPDVAAGAEGPEMGGGSRAEAVSDNPRTILKAWMAADAKVTPLKILQGLIWQAGYASGELQGHVYDEVAPVLRSLCARGYRLAIFSSGSVAAQRLLFRHSVAGDLTPYIEAYFDTRTGAKREASSYRAIARALRLPPASCAFFSDIAPELHAATEAGMPCAQLVRPGGAPAPGQTHLPDFHALDAWVTAYFS